MVNVSPYRKIDPAIVISAPENPHVPNFSHFGQLFENDHYSGRIT
jgi:hypothetical protein